MSQTFQQLWQVIVESKLLNVIGALLILLIGWMIAAAVGFRITVLVRRAAKKNQTSAEDMPHAECADTLAGRSAYWIIMLFAVLGCFSVLNLNAAAEPLKDFISGIARYMPNIIGALLLILAAWIMAGIIRAAVKSAMLKSKLNEKLATQLNSSDPAAIARYAANTAYYTVFLFFLPAVLNALKIYGITEPLQLMLEKVISYLPNLLAAIVICAVGLWAAAVIRRAVTGLLVISRLNLLGEKAGVSKLFGNGGLASMVGVTAYILVAIPVVISALSALKIKVLTDTVGAFFEQLLNGTSDIIGAALVIFAAVLAGGFAAGWVQELTAAFGLDCFAGSLGYKAEGKNCIKASAIAGKIAFIIIMVSAVLAACDILQFIRLAALIKSFALFGGNLLLSIAVLLIGSWLAKVAGLMLEGKCSGLVIGAARLGIIIFTLALAVSNLQIGNGIVEIAFALILGAVCVAAAVAFGIGGRDAAGKLLNDWAEKLRK